MRLIQTRQLLRKQGPGFTLGPLDLELAPGEILGIHGPSGAGKTTLLRLLWGFLRPDDGSVTVLGLTPHLSQIRIRRRAGFLSDRVHLPEWMTSGQYLAFTAAFYPTYDHDRATYLLGRLGLGRNSRVRTLDGAQRRRLALVAALTHYPELLLLDEPTSGLPSSVQREIHDFLLDIANEGVGIVLSAGARNDLDSIADRFLELDDGRATPSVAVGESGPEKEVSTRPLIPARSR